MKIDLDVRGEDIAARRLRQFAEHAKDGRRFFDRVAKVLLAEERALWRRKSGWPPLDPDTIRRKAREGQPARLMHATGALERALTVWGAPGQKLHIRNDRLEFGIDPNGPVSYGIYHQTGRGVPKRVILDTTRSTRHRVRDALYDHLFGR